MGALSHDQFAAQVNAGGASRMLHTHEEPVSKVGVYAVGLKGHEKTYAPPVLRQHVVEHEKSLLADPTVASNPRAMQGGWLHKGEAFLDGSVRVEGRRAAQSLGRANAQIAAYDMGHDRDVYMKRGPAQSVARAANRQRAKTASRVPGPVQKVRGSRAVGYTVEPRRR